VNELSKIKVPVPLLELAKLPSQREKLKKFLNEEDSLKTVQWYFKR
jgi:hypothetical protein